MRYSSELKPFLELLQSDIFFSISFSVFVLALSIAVLYQYKIFLIKKNIDKGNIISESIIKGKVVHKKEYIAGGRCLSHCVTVKLSSEEDGKIVELDGASIYCATKKDEECLFLSRDVKYKNKQYTYIQLKDSIVCDNKFFINSKASSTGNILAITVFAPIFLFLIYKSLIIIDLMMQVCI